LVYYRREDRDRGRYLLKREATAGKAPGKAGQASKEWSRAKSFEMLIEYCEETGKCRHALISQFFGEREAPQCDYACDWHKEKEGLKKRKREGLASEEWCLTQRQSGAYDECDYE
jgi:superfamily II DNA helicase RecQ